MKKYDCFPIFRKYNNNNNYFKIISNSQFEELIIIGKKYVITNKNAAILPDRNFIQDMIVNENGTWLEIFEEEYTKKINYCADNLTKI